MKSFKSIFVNVAILLIVLILNSCRNSESPKTKSVQSKKAEVDSFEFLWPSFWEYGLPMPKDRESQIVAQWYHFQEKWVAGCVVNDSLETALKKHNKMTDSILSKRFGKNWQEHFEHSVDSLYSIDSEVIRIAKSNNFIADFEMAINKRKIIFNKDTVHSQLEYTAHITQDSNINIVTIHGDLFSHNQIEHINFLRATIDMKKKKVINIDRVAYQE